MFWVVVELACFDLVGVWVGGLLFCGCWLFVFRLCFAICEFIDYEFCRLVVCFFMFKVLLFLLVVIICLISYCCFCFVVLSCLWV